MGLGRSLKFVAQFFPSGIEAIVGFVLRVDVISCVVCGVSVGIIGCCSSACCGCWSNCCWSCVDPSELALALLLLLFLAVSPPSPAPNVSALLSLLAAYIVLKNDEVGPNPTAYNESIIISIMAVREVHHSFSFTEYWTFLKKSIILKNAGESSCIKMYISTRKQLSIKYLEQILENSYCFIIYNYEGLLLTNIFQDYLKDKILKSISEFTICKFTTCD